MQCLGPFVYRKVNVRCKAVWVSFPLFSGLNRAVTIFHRYLNISTFYDSFNAFVTANLPAGNSSLF
jgi:hypothetical protein